MALSECVCESAVRVYVCVCEGLSDIVFHIEATVCQCPIYPVMIH